MVTVTECAAELLKDIEEAQEEHGNKILRLVSSGDTFELGFDDRREGDQVVQSGDSDVLLVGRDVSSMLGDAMVDCTDTPDGPRLTLLSKGGPPV